ncbi:hypothetical protein V1525DRAFT_396514 [Lipomyces kononenkoae]|uniref:Uncharacterized protein n=1 Tax=Lipomyces kononenkoae TaxID=34357 RepID=A0ACC3T8G9_LIPKO
MNEQNPVQAKRVLIRSLIRQVAEVLNRKSLPSRSPVRSHSGTYRNNRDLSVGPFHGTDKVASEAGPVDIPVTELMRSLSPEEQSIFVTLHYLLPFTFIPALDLLDKGVIEFVEPIFAEAKKGEEVGIGPVAMFRVATALDDLDPSYERVRIGTWTCSCMHFFKHAVMISEVADLLEFGDNEREDSVPASVPDEIGDNASETGDDWFLKVGECTHVVACFIAKSCGDNAKQFVRRVNAESIDSWLEICEIPSIPHAGAHSMSI